MVIHSSDFDTVNVGKWNFDMDSIKLFGFVASDKGVASDPGKGKVISKMPTPHIKDVYSFLREMAFPGVI